MITQPSTAKSRQEIISSFETSLKEVKGISTATVLKRLSYLDRLLNALNINTSSDLSEQINTASISTFFFDYGQNHGPGSRTNMATCVRSFLTFCYVYGFLECDYSALVPTARHWQQSNIPKAVDDESIRCLLASIGDSSAFDLRDKALILLLIVYGVRGAQVRRLCLGDLDWEAELIHFPAVKGGLAVTQVMDTEVGNSLSAYLQKGRPPSSFQEVFLTNCRGVHPLHAHTTLSDIVRRRLKRANIELPAGVSYGSHGFRHAFATRLVGNVPFPSLSRMLGHKNISSTFIYSKVNFPMLREAVLPWPEEV